MIPLKLVTFWHRGELPWLAQRCFQIMQVQNPMFDVKCLSSADLEETIRDDFGHEINALLSSIELAELTNTRKSELLRLLHMYKHGGVWLDIHCVCATCVSEVFDLHDDTFQGWTTFQESIDTWGFACNKDNAFLQDWICELLKALSDPVSYMLQHRERFMESSKKRACLLHQDHHYFIMYWASIIARERHRLLLREAMDPTDPLFYCRTGYEGIFEIALPKLVKLDSTARVQLRLLTSAHLRRDVSAHILQLLNIRTIKEWNRIVRKCPKTKFN